MPENRFYTPTPFAVGSRIVLEEDEARHLFVMRKSTGETLELINGQGELATAQLVTLNKRTAEAEVISVYKEPPPPFQLIIAQATPRFSRLDVILEKGTELGMSALWLFPGDLSEKTNFSPSQHQRMHNLLVAAMKQCGRLYLPELKLIPPLMQWTALPFPLFYGDVGESAPPFQKAWHTSVPQKGAIFVIGPEKGLSDQETTQLKQLGAQGVSLNRNILRTDTAPLAALSLMSHFLL